MFDDSSDFEDSFEISEFRDYEVDDYDSLYDLERSPHINSIREQAIDCMELFFVDKKYWAGGAISKKKLYSEQNIMTVMQVNILDAFTVAYDCLSEQKPQNYDTSKKRWEIELCYDVIKECSRRYIPKSNAGGMLLVYLAICQGVDYFSVLKQNNANALLHGKYIITI